MYEFFDERRDLHRLLLSGANAESEMFAHGRRLLGAFILESKRRGALDVDDLHVIVEFVLHGLHGLLLRFIHEGHAAASSQPTRSRSFVAFFYRWSDPAQARQRGLCKIP